MYRITPGILSADYTDFADFFRIKTENTTSF
jgi:hypothetical protein